MIMPRIIHAHIHDVLARWWCFVACTCISAITLSFKSLIFVTACRTHKLCLMNQRMRQVYYWSARYYSCHKPCSIISTRCPSGSWSRMSGYCFPCMFMKNFDTASLYLFQCSRIFFFTHFESKMYSTTGTVSRELYFFFGCFSNKTKQNCPPGKTHACSSLTKSKAARVYLNKSLSFGQYLLHKYRFLLWKGCSWCNLKEESQLSESNRRPAHYEGAALPTELSWLKV